MKKQDGCAGETTQNGADVADLAAKRVSRNINQVHEERLTLGDRLADGMAGFAGSWTFISAFIVIMLIWITVNAVPFLFHTFDPYPFILLNLVLSCIAAIQAPIIMMSQNRQEKKDRLHAEHDFQVNLKAEILIEHVIHQLAEIESAQREMKLTQERLLDSLEQEKTVSENKQSVGEGFLKQKTNNK